MARSALALFSVLALCLFAGPSAAQTPQAGKIIDEMILALGGQAFLDVDDIHTTGRFFQFKRGELASGDNFADYIKFPMAERVEFGREKNKEITVNNGKEGWKMVPKDKEAQEQLAAEIQEFQASFKTTFDYLTRFSLSNPQTTLQHIGSEIVDFNRADVIEIRDPLKNRIVLFIDRRTKLPIKMQVRRIDEKVVREERFGNWHKFQGIMTPLFVSRFTDGEKKMEIRLNTAVYNSGLPASLFTAPKK